MESLLGLVLLHIIALASPGPDYLLVSRYALLKGRKLAYMASFGIASGVLVHVTFCLAGLGALLSRWPQAYTALRCIGAIYLMYLGLCCVLDALKQRKENAQKPMNEISPDPKGSSGIIAAIEPSILNTFATGFVTNVLNPKAMIFFAGLFTAFIPTEHVWRWGIIAAFALFTLTAAWFCLLAYVLSHPKLQTRAKRFQSRLEAMTGLIFISLGCAVLLLPSVY